MRPFALTGGRTRPSRADFTLITTVTAADPQPEGTRPEGAVRAQPEHGRILRLCAAPVAVVELAARLDLPVSVVVILLSDLLEAGRVVVRPPHPVSRVGPGLELLQRVRKCLDSL
ncbi:DUF742 domain-containing protein (plasmid) [Streptomyces sp. HUAS 31]|uniref:DUF742 domain-containing protein n=1 Tax=Streptomyces TaxID=1883 RepID=UPI0023062F6F|nr:DUF742 domain-containing protein [Streptomyces sp. HUAS 31]WCE02535.1 DUF742 domain-containing protein [Streptomyces sp. HUAS 31]